QGKAAGRPIDWSNVDFAVAKILAGAGHQAGEIEAAIIEHSPNLEDRKKGHGADYAARTAAKATEAVLAERAARRPRRERDRDNGPSL
ncbi:MAG: DNA topoisomerase, partial [Alphaproteobacteria bacterium]|nr:DNA topoisomerase [Alphaproteobacteria bacterium]